MSQTLLIADDDPALAQVLARALGRRGFTVSVAGDMAAALALVQAEAPVCAVVDLKFGAESGLRLIEALHRHHPACRIVMLTGYASIATAIEAIKLGAVHYLAKPASADEIVAAFERQNGDAGVPVTAQPLSVERLEWEHIQKVLSEHDGNVSATARALNMHRRTLQRKLAKRPSPNPPPRV
ncbi:response regulator transcription factor [Chitinimonas lacunae]|uniref:Response regulator transcription factor n=1 Tax=Chitinimonas lacunae TaxID=1963018 RepID=A0ABV8MQ93_9NEIS